MKRKSIRLPSVLILILFLVTADLQLYAQWVLQQTDTKSNLTDVAMLDDTTAITVGMSQTILKTTDAGTTWSYIPTVWSIPQDWNAISFFDVSIGVLAGNKMVVTTTDGGEHWAYRLHSDTSNFTSALCTGPSKYYVGDNFGYIHTTNDSGKSWLTEKVSDYPIRSIFAFRGLYIWTYPVYALTPNSLYKKMEPSEPGGWHLELDDIFIGFGSEAWDGESAFGGGHSFIAGVMGDLWSAMTVLRKKMSDTVWKNVMAEFPKEGILYGISVPSNLVVYACGTNGMIVKSTDGGESWVFQQTSVTKTLRAIFLSDETRGIAVGDSGTIVFTSNGGITGVKEVNPIVPGKPMLEQNFPNPFNSSTNITCRLGNPGFVSLKIYNLLGELVTTLVERNLPAGEFTVRWNAANAASGIYFCRLASKATLSIRKLILIR